MGRKIKDSQTCPEGRCDWHYGQEPREVSGQTIMVWVEQGEPCDGCLSRAYQRMWDTCADSRCSGGRECPQHRHLYERPDDWPSYPLPESAVSRQDDTRRNTIAAYHRTTTTTTTKRKTQSAWCVLQDRLAALDDDAALTDFARRCLEAQADAGRTAPAYGEGIDGTVTLDTDASARLARLIAAQRKPKPDDGAIDIDGWDDDRSDDDAYTPACSTRMDDDSTGGFDLGYLLEM